MKEWIDLGVGMKKNNKCLGKVYVVIGDKEVLQ